MEETQRAPLGEQLAEHVRQIDTWLARAERGLERNAPAEDVAACTQVALAHAAAVHAKLAHAAAATPAPSARCAAEWPHPAHTGCGGIGVHPNPLAQDPLDFHGDDL